MIESFKSIQSKVEYYSLDNKGIIKTIQEEEALNNKVDNIYFTYGLDINSKTRKKDDYVEKKGFMIDLDIRKNFEYLGKISDDDIIKEGINIGTNLKKENQLLGEISYIVFSGNGLQIHYLGDWQYYTPEEYLIGVKEIYKLWDDFWGDNIYKADPACANISRIMRMPGTINQKNGAEAKVIYSNPDNVSALANSISEFAMKKINEANNIKEEQEKRIKKDFSKNENNFYEEINKIPAYVIAQYLIPEFKLNKNGKNFDNKKGGFTGYFYNKNTNSICNGGSRYFNWDDVSSCYNNFALVKHYYNLPNKDTFEFFKILIKK